jgi:hypothetical protein
MKATQRHPKKLGIIFLNRCSTETQQFLDPKMVSGIALLHAFFGWLVMPLALFSKTCSALNTNAGDEHPNILFLYVE